MPRKKHFKPETIPYHPSYGYVYPEQIKKLAELKDGQDYKDLVKKIELQNKNKGRIES